MLFLQRGCKSRDYSLELVRKSRRKEGYSERLAVAVAIQELQSFITAVVLRAPLPLLNAHALNPVVFEAAPSLQLYYAVVLLITTTPASVGNAGFVTAIFVTKRQLQRMPEP
jgi:hypothetical protein